jgi:hypothetical protein
MYAVGDLDSQLAENVNNGVHFDFDHTTAYAAIEFDVRLFASVTVSAITMTVSGGTPDQNMVNGTYTYDIATQTATLAGGSNSIALTGLNLSIGNGDKVYFPMPAKTFAGQTFTFYCTFSGLGGNTYSQYVTGTPASFEFVRGEINTIRLAPTTAAYTANQTFTVSKTGYYYIEVWGGNGGKGGDSNADIIGSLPAGDGGGGGTALPIRGLYFFSAGNALNIQVGSAGGNGQNGIDATSDRNPGTGGVATWFGNGRTGGYGSGAYYSTSHAGSGGGGGGAASGVLLNGTALSNILIASGGGGGGGGAGGEQNAGKGGDSANAGGSVQTTGNYGRGGGSAPSTSSTDGQLYGSGSIDGNESNAWYIRGGGGGGGAGGGWNGASGGGGFSGTGGNNISGLENANRGAGGGGAGGASYKTTEASPYSGYVAPNASTRPGANGYVVITFMKRAD